MTEVIFTFDTEDYTNPGADDAILWLAEILRAEGIRASFNMVAALAEALVARERQDVLDALAYHEINYHTYRHSWHPVPAEYSDTPDWDGPYRRLVEEEAPGIEVVKQVFDRDRLYVAVPPGNCVTAQALFAYPELGLPLCVSSFPMHETGGRTIHYGGGLYLENNTFWDSLILSEGLEGVLSRIEAWRAWERLVICMHPNLTLYQTFWDALNLDGANHVEWGQWRLPERRSQQVIEQFFADFRQAVRALKQDGHFTFATFQKVVEDVPARPDLSRAVLDDLLEQARDKFFIKANTGSSDVFSYSLAEMFAASVHFLSGGEGDYAPEPVAGPLTEPVGIREPAVLSAAALHQAAAELVGLRSIPAQVPVDGILVGPRDFLDAARQVLRGASEAVLAPQPQSPETDNFYHIDEAHLAGTWMYSPAFADEWVSRRLKWQAWTIHL